MKVFISHESALEYWRIHRVMPKGSDERRPKVLIPNNPPVTKQVKRTGLTPPVHVLLSNPNVRWLSQTMKQHVLTSKTTAGCFIGVEDWLMVSSPEFCFIQMAGTLSLVKLIELGYEFCGAYSLPVAEDPEPPERGFYKRKPLTSKKNLGVFISHMSNIKGCKKAELALRYVIDDSASPMETKLSVLLTLPYRFGGFGLITPELNSYITLTKTAKQSSSKSFYICDMFWADYNLAVEYDSAQYHSGSEHIATDSKKRNALSSMGVMVITVTKQQLYSRMEFEKVARILAKRLGKRLVLKNSFKIAHRGLRKELFL